MRGGRGGGLGVMCLIARRRNRNRAVSAPAVPCAAREPAPAGSTTRWRSAPAAPGKSSPPVESDHRQGHPVLRSIEVHYLKPDLGGVVKDLPLVFS